MCQKEIAASPEDFGTEDISVAELLIEFSQTPMAIAASATAATPMNVRIEVSCPC
jgi:hypothetical protein